MINIYSELSQQDERLYPWVFPILPPLEYNRRQRSINNDVVTVFNWGFRFHWPRNKRNEEIKVEPSEIDLEYERRWKAMSAAEKIARSAAMFAWTRQQMARRIHSDQPSLSEDEVKWHVALKLYEREPEVVKLIQEQLSSVSR
jgi:hypothetical protein